MALDVALVWLCLSLTGAPALPETLSQARQALRAKDLASAKRLLDAAEAQRPRRGQAPAAERYELLMMRGELALADSDLETAARRFRDASHAAEDDSKRRRRALTQRLRVAEKRKDKRALRLVRELEQRDGEVAQLQRRPRAPPAALAKTEAQLLAAARLYQRDRDAARAAWARSVAVRVRAYSAEDAAAALAHAARAVHLVSRLPAYVQLVALEAAAQAARRAAEQDRELDFVLRHNALVHRAVDEAERPFARTKLLSETCARLEKERGPAVCALRSRALTGVWSFQDFSLGAPKSALSALDLAPANAQYLPAVRDCIETIARENREDELFQAARVKVEWVVSESGRVAELEISPQRYDPYFGECVRSAAAIFRYPRSTGERQTVSVSFELEGPATQPRRGG